MAPVFPLEIIWGLFGPLVTLPFLPHHLPFLHLPFAVPMPPGAILFVSLQETGPSRKECNTILLWCSPGERTSWASATQRANSPLECTQVSSSARGFCHTHPAFPWPELPLAPPALGGSLREPVLIRGPNYILPNVHRGLGDGRKEKTSPSKIKTSRNSKFHPLKGSEWLLRPSLWKFSGQEPSQPHFYILLPSTSTAFKDLWLLSPSTHPHNHEPFTLKWLKIVSWIADH